MPAPVDWLLAGEPYLAYRTRLDLLGQPESDPLVAAARRAMLADPAVGAIVSELAGWPGAVVASHKSAGQPFHKLTFLADLGLRATDPGMEAIITRIMAHQSAQGPFQLPTNVPEHYGGTGEETWGWALCDAPLIVYALLSFGRAGERPPYRPRSPTSRAWCETTAGPAPSPRRWAAGAGRGARRTPAPTPTWPCSKRWPWPGRTGAMARRRARAPRRC